MEFRHNLIKVLALFLCDSLGVALLYVLFPFLVDLQNDCSFFSCPISVFYHPVEKRLSVFLAIKKSSILHTDLTNSGSLWGEAGGIYNVFG